MLDLFGYTYKEALQLNIGDLILRKGPYSWENALIKFKQVSEIGHQVFEWKYLSIQINLHEMINEVVSLISHTIDKRIVIKQKLNAYKPLIKGDPSQIQNTIMNLAINARDAMPDGGEMIFSTDIISINKAQCKSFSYEITPGSYVQLCVTDNGCGIDKEIIGNIFDPFFTTKEPGKGTGMGLPAVFGTAKSHGGAISVYSEIGYGTTMKMYLPQVLNSNIGDTEIIRINKVEKGNANILLIDDEELFLDSSSQMLEKLGYNIFMCRNGEEAIALYKKNWKNIDLVILDMIMPVMDGKTCFHKMQKINPEMKVLISSGFIINGRAQALLNDGVKDFIQKPFLLAELSQKINKIL
jgi:CheY-like chemotaxis protein